WPGRSRLNRLRQRYSRSSREARPLAPGGLDRPHGARRGKKVERPPREDQSAAQKRLIESGGGGGAASSIICRLRRTSRDPAGAVRRIATAGEGGGREPIAQPADQYRTKAAPQDATDEGID